jgi:hypothetical protein
MRLRVVSLAAATVLCAVVVAVGAFRKFTPSSTTASYGPFNSFLAYRTPGSSVISKDRAIAVATKWASKYWTAPMRIDAKYGLFSDDTMCRERNDYSKCVLLYQKVPAWVVTVTGADACLLPSGGPVGRAGPPPTATAAQKALCQENYVINAKTGKQLLEFN